MENIERSLIENAISIKPNPRLVSLYKEHKILNEKVEQLTNRSFLTSNEELELKKLKKEKLNKFEEMLNIARAVV